MQINNNPMTQNEWIPIIVELKKDDNLEEISKLALPGKYKKLGPSKFRPCLPDIANLMVNIASSNLSCAYKAAQKLRKICCRAINDIRNGEKAAYAYDFKYTFSSTAIPSPRFELFLIQTLFKPTFQNDGKTPLKFVGTKGIRAFYEIVIKSTVGTKDFETDLNFESIPLQYDPLESALDSLSENINACQQRREKERQNRQSVMLSISSFLSPLPSDYNTQPPLNSEKIPALSNLLHINPLPSLQNNKRKNPNELPHHQKKILPSIEAFDETQGPMSSEELRIFLKEGADYLKSEKEKKNEEKHTALLNRFSDPFLLHKFSVEDGGQADY